MGKFQLINVDHKTEKNCYQVEKSEFLSRGRFDHFLIPSLDDGDMVFSMMDQPQ
jgi:hypothetical protein